MSIRLSPATNYLRRPLSRVKVHHCKHATQSEKQTPPGATKERILRRCIVARKVKWISFVTFGVAEIVTAESSKGRAAGELHLAGARHCYLTRNAPGRTLFLSLSPFLPLSALLRVNPLTKFQTTLE